MSNELTDIHDLLIIGGGINGAGIARDAAGRGLSVLLCEKGDIGGATSSASSKLVHGGLRYLEHFEFRLVGEALAEREVMLRIAPHLTRPLRFIMPYVPTLRPAWMIRLGLLLYDTLGRLHRHATLPGSQAVDLRRSPFGAGLQETYTKGYVYSDATTDDARLALATARDAAERGATILPRTSCVSARRTADAWQVTLESSIGRQEVRCRALVNAAGPWVASVKLMAEMSHHQDSHTKVQLIKGSHIVVKKLYDGHHAYILQNDDRRVIFLIPCEGEFTLIGTTEIKVADAGAPTASPEEIAYLCRAASRFSRRPVTSADVVWHYSGVRPLYDDGHGDPAAVTRDYTFVLDADATGHLPLLSIFGGKLTTHRKLAEAALERLAAWFPQMGPGWTDSLPLPGGNFTSFGALLAGLCQAHPMLPPQWLERLARRHGTLAEAVLGNAQTHADLGLDFGGGLTQCEVEYFVAHEWAQTSDDILWRRSKCGLHMNTEQRTAFIAWFEPWFAKRDTQQQLKTGEK